MILILNGSPRPNGLTAQMILALRIGADYALDPFDPEFASKVKEITGGGVKVSRFVILAKATAADFRKLLHPRSVKVTTMDGKPISREQRQGSARAKAVYGELLAAAEALLVLVKGRKGRTNKENAKMASQIRELIRKWKD